MIFKILKHTEILENALSLQGLMFLIGKLCIVAAIGFAYYTGITVQNAQGKLISVNSSQSTKPTNVERVRHSRSSYDVIVKRDMFGKKAAAPRMTPVSPKTSNLKLRLVGTSTGHGSAPFAIIEDTKKRVQDTFDLDETIFDSAKLLEVFPDSVRISHGGKVETLIMEEGSAPSTTEVASASDEDKSSFTIGEQELTDALANLPRLLSQARAVPYFKNGESVGMRLFAIRRGSLYEKLGLKNGDIIKSVNEHSLSDPSQALKIFEQLKSERSIYVNLERAGADKKLSYDIQ